MNKTFKHYVLLIILALGFSACGVYSFTGVSLSAEAKTVSVDYFNNTAALNEPTLSQIFTDGLRDYFASQTSLDLIDRDGDLDLKGTIVDYNTRPMAITGDDKAALNRLTIRVKVSFVNFFDDTKNYETTFTQHADYDSSLDLLDVQDQLISEITDALIEDIFNKAVVNW